MPSKEFCVTTDYMSDLLHHGRDRHYNRQQLDQLMAYSAALGARRHEWVADTWLLDDNLSGDPVANGLGFDFLEEVCAAAHRHGLRLDVVFKPFEGTMPQQMLPLPETFPRPAGVPVLVENGGLWHAVRPFLVDHPEMRLARAPGAPPPAPGDVAAIRLLKQDAAPLNFSLEQLSVWTSARNGQSGFARYQGPLSMCETLEFTPSGPRGERPGRVITISGFELPADTRYIMLRCDKHDGSGEFYNDNRRIMALLDRQGRILPSSVAGGPLDGEKLYRQTSLAAGLGLSRYLHHPEIMRLIQDKPSFLAHCAEAYNFKSENHIALDQGQAAVARLGCAQHITGALHPVYPEVRRYWLQLVDYCLKRGADGVNIRVASHNRTLEPWAYGFNPPVIEKMIHPAHAGEASRINGAAYTQFLREAAEFIHERGREVGVHVNSGIFTRFAAHGSGPLPLNFDWDWQSWVSEIADYVEFRGAGLMFERKAARPQEELICLLEHVGLVAREAGLPFMLQSSRMTDRAHFDGATHWLEQQLEWVRRHPDISIYNLYETVAFTRVNESGNLEGSPKILQAVQRAECKHKEHDYA